MINMAEDRNSDHLYSTNTKAGAKSRVAIHHVLEGSLDSGIKLEGQGMHQNAHQVSPTPVVIQSNKPVHDPAQLSLPHAHHRYPIGGKPQYIIYRGPQQQPPPPTVVISRPGSRPGSHGSASLSDSKRSTPSPRGGQYRVSPVPDRQSPASRDSPISHMRVSPVPRDVISGVAAHNVLPQRDAMNQINKSRDSNPGGFVRTSPGQRVSPVPRESPVVSRMSPVPREASGLLRVSPVNQNRASPTSAFRNTSSPASQLQHIQAGLVAARNNPSPGLLQGILQGGLMEAQGQGVSVRPGLTNSHSPPPPSSLPSTHSLPESIRKPIFTGPIPVPTSFTLPLERTENPLLVQLQQQQQAALLKLAARGNPSLAKVHKGRDGEDQARSAIASTSETLTNILKSRNPPRHIDIPASVSTAIHSNHVAGSSGVLKEDAQPSSSSKAPHPLQLQSSAANAESHNSLAQPLTIDTNVITTIAKTIAEMIGLKSPSQLSHIKQKADTSTTHSPPGPGGMPRLHKEISSSSTSASHAKDPKSVAVKTEEKDDKKPVEIAPVENPFNMRVNNLNNFPSGQTGYRATYRSQTVAIHRAKAGSITSAAKSLDILRQNLQKYINREIDDIIQRYLAEYFEPAVTNIKLNNGDGSINEDHVKAVCRQMLEEAKKMYPDETTRSSTPDVSENSGEVDSTTSNSNILQENSFVRQNKYKVFNIKKRRGSTDSEKSNKSIPHKKRKGRPPLHTYGTSGRLTPSKTGKSDMVRREGPKWDPVRLKEETMFIMGARANKALGLGQTRGRLYIKHPDCFKYSGDQEDKNYLHEHHHMPATGGKAYMLLLEDIKELCESDEYRGNPALQLNELVGFPVPPWMLEKMKIQMQAMRTDYKPKVPAVSLNPGSKDDDVDENEPPLPFASLQDNSQVSKGSPANTVDLLSTEDQEEELVAAVSPFHVIGGNFDDVSPAPDVSPQASDLDGIDEEASFAAFIND